MERFADAYFFRDLEEKEIEELRAITRIVEATRGTLLLRQGQPSESLYVVRTGSVRVLLPYGEDEEDIPTAPERTLVVLGPGECFGEFAFVDRKPSSATVVAKEDSTLYALAHRDLDAKLQGSPSTAAKIYKSLLHILVSRFRNTDIEMAMRRAVG